MVTSGNYEKYYECNNHNFGTSRFHHLIDPRTGWPVKDDISGGTVVAKSSALADALSTAAFVLGIDKGLSLCEYFLDTHVLFIDKNGKIFMSEAMSYLFTCTRKDGNK